MPKIGSADYVPRDEALKLLGVKSATLYTYVSRGWVRSVQVAGTRARVFAREDLERLKVRSRARQDATSRGESALRWGIPVIRTAITDVTKAGPSYRGNSAIELARGGTRFESVAQLLWTGTFSDSQITWASPASREKAESILELVGKRPPAGDILKVFSIVTLVAGIQDGGARELDDGTTIVAAQRVIQLLIGACGFLSATGRFRHPKQGESIAVATVKALGVEPEREIVHAVNSALVLSADFELAPGTFAARVAASSGCDLYACLTAGFSAHSGALTGGNTQQVEALLLDGDDHGDRANRKRKLALARECGVRLYGFNHPLFPLGDPRALELIALAKSLRNKTSALSEAFWLLDEARHRYDLHAGLGIGLVTLCIALGLPRHSALALWTIGRTAGFVAHVIEQRLLGFKIRPRANYAHSGPLIVDRANRS